jgi:glyceraldehyde-3-phosphate dehydrogenase (NADP+)
MRNAVPFVVGGVNCPSQEQPAMIEPLVVYNPFDGSVVEEVAQASIENVERAIVAAQEGSRLTRELSACERSEILMSIANALKNQKEEIAKLISLEVGKPIQFSRIEVDRAILTFSTASEEAKRIGGEALPLDFTKSTAGRFGITRRFPIGIVLAITPFNFPLNLVAHKIAPAIAAGNSFILKPAPQGSLTALRFASIISNTMYPKKAINVLPCSNDAAEKIVADDRIAMLSFTGSAAVGWKLKSLAGKKKVTLELGGNAGVIIDENVDPETVVKSIALGAFAYAGQVCIKVQRIFVHESIAGQFVTRFMDVVRSLKCGDPNEEEVIVGPLINITAIERIEHWLAEAEQAGAKFLLRGTRKGRVLTPSILQNVSKTSKIYCEEVFGPVVTLHTFKTIEDAVEQINDTKYGLQAGLFSNNFENILYAYDHIQTGAVIVNDTPTFRIDPMPYGGIKESGIGKEGVKYAMREMSEEKLLVIAR